MLIRRSRRREKKKKRNRNYLFLRIRREDLKLLRFLIGFTKKIRKT